MSHPRRPRGTGTIEPLPDGRFRPRLPAPRRTRLAPCATWEDAARDLDTALSLLADREVVPVGGLTLAAFGEDVLDDREIAGLRSVRTDRSRWATHVTRSPLASLPLSQVTRAGVRDWLDALLRARAKPGRGQRPGPARRLSRVTVQNTLNLLRCVLEAAVEKGLIEQNPARGVRLPRSQGTTHEPWTYLLPAEQAALLAALDEPDRDLVTFALYTGLRQGELYNLRAADVGERVVVRFGSKGKATKGGRIRRVPLFGLALAAWERQKARLQGQPNPEGLAWPTARGHRRQKGKAPPGWRRALERAGLADPTQRHDGRPVRFHDLRHTCASSLVAGWWGRAWSLERIKGLLGHRSITTTERYAHLADSALDAAARATPGLVAAPIDLPKVYPEPAVDESGNALFSAAPLRRLERPTNGLGRRGVVEEDRGVGLAGGQIEGRSARALAALEALAAGRPEAWRLATTVLVEVVRDGAGERGAGVERRAC